VTLMSSISRSADYTFISFEMVACYGSRRFAPYGTVTSISRKMREVVTGDSSQSMPRRTGTWV